MLEQYWWVDSNVIICAGIIVFMLAFVAGWSVASELEDDDGRWPW